MVLAELGEDQRRPPARRRDPRAESSAPAGRARRSGSRCRPRPRPPPGGPRSRRRSPRRRRAERRPAAAPRRPPGGPRRRCWLTARTSPRAAPRAGSARTARSPAGARRRPRSRSAGRPARGDQRLADRVVVLADDRGRARCRRRARRGSAAPFPRSSSRTGRSRAPPHRARPPDRRVDRRLRVQLDGVEAVAGGDAKGLLRERPGGPEVGDPHAVPRPRSIIRARGRSRAAPAPSPRAPRARARAGSARR